MVGEDREGLGEGGLQPRQQVMAGIRGEEGTGRAHPKEICELQRRSFFGRSGLLFLGHTSPVEALFVRNVVR